MIQRAVVAFVAAVAVLGPCEGGLSGVDGGVVKGTWGGENAGLMADDTSAHVHIGCTYGNVHQQILPDADGKYDVAGEHNITAHPVDAGVFHPARFSGVIAGGRVMTLAGTLTDNAETVGPVTPADGEEPRVGAGPSFPDSRA